MKLYYFIGLTLLFGLISTSFSTKKYHILNQSTIDHKTINIKNRSDLILFLKAHKVPFPSVWGNISVLEAGHNWESTLATKYHNFMGFNQCYFKSKNDCAKFLIQWINSNPPRKNETYQQFLIRRNYNPNHAYYLKQLSLISKMYSK